jgi:hypothetical protein
VDRAIVEIEFRSLDQARALARRARSEHLHQDRVGTVGPEPIVKEDDHPESDRTSTEGTCRSPSDFPWRKHDAVEAGEANDLYEEHGRSELARDAYERQGVSANARAITTEKVSTSPSAARIPLAFRADIIGPAPTRSQTM